VTAQAADDATAPRLIVPAYFHPATHPAEWAWLARHSADMTAVVLNLASGPGDQIDPVVLPFLEPLRAAGVSIGGYVDTNYGQRPVSEVMADLRRYLDWYDIDAVFYDRSAVSAEYVGHYAGLGRRARDAGVSVVAFNHGAHPIEPYAEEADLLGTFEGPWAAYLEMAVPRWVRSHPAEQFFHLVHAVPVEDFADARWLAWHRNAGSAYITDRSGINPWDGIPTQDPLWHETAH
jgi:hypothetical protein